MRRNQWRISVKRIFKIINIIAILYNSFQKIEKLIKTFCKLIKSARVNIRHIKKILKRKDYQIKKHLILNLKDK